MKLPNRENVFVANEKLLLEYILSKTHPLGKFKAKLFRGIGFNEANVMNYPAAS